MLKNKCQDVDELKRFMVEEWEKIPQETVKKYYYVYETEMQINLGKKRG